MVAVTVVTYLGVPCCTGLPSPRRCHGGGMGSGTALRPCACMGLMSSVGKRAGGQSRTRCTLPHELPIVSLSWVLIVAERAWGRVLSASCAALCSCTCIGLLSRSAGKCVHGGVR